MAGSEKIVEVTDDNFKATVKEGEGLFMLDFWATWCGPCRLVAPIMEEMAEEYDGKGLTVGKLDVDSNPKTASSYGIRSIPSIVFFKGGEVLEKVIGAVPRQHIEEKVQQYLD